MVKAKPRQKPKLKIVEVKEEEDEFVLTDEIMAKMLATSSTLFYNACLDGNREHRERVLVWSLFKTPLVVYHFE